ncbi:hypothetical protein B0H10DRAFT_2147205 [Mycena sp. CBHHK59/15]|nr:hypothetical protein B0H10DRAFT_2147205 [Mycena sp. CBHHK59/15]
MSPSLTFNQIISLAQMLAILGGQPMRGRAMIPCRLRGYHTWHLLAAIALSSLILGDLLSFKTHHMIICCIFLFSFVACSLRIAMTGLHVVVALISGVQTYVVL